MKWLLSLLLLCSVALCTQAAEPAPSPTPLRQAHAHNDYEHRRPLFDALDQGFCNVEADIYLVDGQLLVAHDRRDVKPERTLQALYLDPLRERIARNGGRVFPGGPSETLLIDVKSDAAATYQRLREVLLGYTNLLTQFTAQGVQPGAITVIISGNRDRSLLEPETVRYAALDGRPSDLDGSSPSSLIPWISQDWKTLFQWRGVGPFPAAERERLEQLVERAHAQGRQVRLWGTPDRPALWRELLRAKVDILNADDLRGLRVFLTSTAPSP